ncbi:AAA family ATPase [Acetonema longum]|uniref:MoxR-like ATPase n=1 Tax=Acetonema longum DSM 6540 TaxID=1009370 RepID=F7NKP9_9FIRM|nr:MoxR family ATPase [Acetonema longum]EGO63353.1 MoxR-like ATPase [Acetonema longum DSM 6540]
MDLKALRKACEAEHYVFDENLLTTVFVAIKLGKPLLIEGAAGVGKTEVAKVLAAAFGVELIRLQCYAGLDEAKALYEWNYQKQLLSIQLDLQQNTAYSSEQKLESLFSRDFLLERPLLRAIGSDAAQVLLIDEIDKSDEEFEAFLLELLSDFQVSIPELGTIRAQNKPVIVLTSNNTRQLSDALRRRCAYLFIDYPSAEKEIAIIHAKVAGVPAKLASDIAAAVACLRQNEKIFKKPSIAETLDWVAALTALDKKRLDEESAMKTLGFVLKNQEDILEFTEAGGFGKCIAEQLR